MIEVARRCARRSRLRHRRRNAKPNENPKRVRLAFGRWNLVCRRAGRVLPPIEADLCFRVSFFSRSQRRSGGSNRASKGPTDTMTMAGEDAAFLLGAGGSTKRKVARAAGARLELDDDADGKHVLTVSGPDASRARAMDYVRWVLKQRLGAIEVSGASARDDLSIVRVPADCVAYVTGKSGRVLRSVEEEFGTLLFFGKLVGDSGERTGEETERGQTIETLCVLGDRRGRRGAELKVMSAVEHKTPGWYVNDEKKLRARLKQPGDGEGDGFGYDVFPFEDHEFSYALGAQVRFSSRPFRRFRFCFRSFGAAGGS